jgi:pilus assembly protein Flp/PilA
MRSGVEKETVQMKDMLLKSYVKASILREDCGQDLIEYALVAALIAFAAVVGMNDVAGQINVAFSKIGSKIVSAVS